MPPTAIRRRLLPILALMLLTGTPCLAQVEAEVLPAGNIVASGSILDVTIDVDLLTGGEMLGSYGAELLWDPNDLQYLGDSGGGQPPFDNAVVNNLNAGLGILTFSDAAPAGAGGRVNIMNVQFRVVGPPCVVTAVRLDFTSMFAAVTFADLRPVLTTRDAAFEVPDDILDLRATDPVNTLMNWGVAPGGVSYDVIKGDVRQLFDDLGGFIHLGTVACFEDDSLDTTTGAGTEPNNPDTAVPLVGEAFFYLIRHHDGLQNRTYGFTRACGQERIVDAGDCP